MPPPRHRRIAPPKKRTPLLAPALLCLSLGLSLGLAHAADVIDRIAVSVGNRVITASDLDREIRVTAFLAGVPPDFSPDARRATAERMVEQTLIRRELDTSRYPIPALEEVDPALQDFKKKHFAGDEEYRKSLQTYGIAEQDVREELLWQRTLLMFLGVRFRAGVQVTDRELQDYWTRVVEPAARTAHPGSTPAFADYRNQIEEKLTGDRVDSEVDAWLKDGRKRTDIVFHEEAFR